VSARRIELAAPAKVNLTLAVLGRRSDGYHEIDSVMMGLALADRLAVEERDQAGVTLAVHGPAAGGVPADGSNLAVRAAEAVRALARAAGHAAPGLHLELEKRIPAQAGRYFANPILRAESERAAGHWSDLQFARNRIARLADFISVLSFREALEVEVEGNSLPVGHRSMLGGTQHP
jgi:4-diphosphocytidyl-2-C-methyl-D-erythritol kinase